MNEISNLMVCALGIGIVFTGLVSIIILCKIVSGVIAFTEQKTEKHPVIAAEVSQAPELHTQVPEETNVDLQKEADLKTLPVVKNDEPQCEVVIPNKEEIIAAVSAAIAESLGTDPAGIRVLSFRQVTPASLPDRQQIIAAVTAAIAESLGTQVQGIRVLSFRQIS